jgi:hypothetical protein
MHYNISNLPGKCKPPKAKFPGPRPNFSLSENFSGQINHQSEKKKGAPPSAPLFSGSE